MSIRKTRWLFRFWAVRIGSFIGILVISYLFFWLVVGIFTRLGVFKYATLASNFIFTPLDRIENFTGRTNILILGKAGGSHAGPDLTDTMIFASVSLTDKKPMSLISIPRDIWIPSLRAKINSAYYWGNQKQEGGGLTLAESTVEQIVGQPINYGMVIDFSAFTKIIDLVGGINVEVKNSFVDEKYPIPGKENDLCNGDKLYKCRYETIRFEKGITMMTGETALKYVRSRNASGDEGTDLARDARQQLVIDALKDKILSRSIITSPKILLAIWSVVKSSVETDMGDGALAILARKIFNQRGNINSQVIPAEMLTNPSESAKYDFQYVFVPKAGDWKTVWTWVKTSIGQGQ
jgi:polyisoprenyl-teichoic acid--peptidoglycan teichoic acid transferase